MTVGSNKETSPILFWERFTLFPKRKQSVVILNATETPYVLGQLIKKAIWNNSPIKL